MRGWLSPGRGARDERPLDGAADVRLRTRRAAWPGGTHLHGWDPEAPVRPSTGGSFARAAIVAGVALLAPTSSPADPVAVAHAEGLAHGFLALHSLEGTIIADGDLIQTSSGDRVTTRLRFRFKDGSTHDETTVYTQGKSFRFVSDHVVQKGPAFKMAIDSTISASGEVTVRYTEDGKEKVIEDRLELPDDLANGMILTLVKNISPQTPKTTVSMLAITQKPRLVKLEFIPTGEEPFSTPGFGRKAMHYVVKVHVPGIAGAIASLLDKIPPDSHIWILGGDAPEFVKAVTPLAQGGPLWRIELVSPTWPSGTPATKDSEHAKDSRGAKN